MVIRRVAAHVEATRIRGVGIVENGYAQGQLHFTRTPTDLVRSFRLQDELGGESI